MGGSRSISVGCHLTAESGKQKQVVMGDVRTKGQNGEPQKPTQTQYRGKDKNLTSKWYTINLLKWVVESEIPAWGFTGKGDPNILGALFMSINKETHWHACVGTHVCIWTPAVWAQKWTLPSEQSSPKHQFTRHQPTANISHMFFALTHAEVVQEEGTMKGSILLDTKQCSTVSKYRGLDECPQQPRNQEVKLAEEEYVYTEGMFSPSLTGLDMTLWWAWPILHLFSTGLK